MLEWSVSEPFSLFDCRFYLAEPDQGKREYGLDHIPGAHYLHLNQDLSGEIGDGSRGRHPLPDVKALWTTLFSMGVTEDSKIVCYDSSGGPYASRLWWLLRHSGFTDIWVLDGGWQAWLAYLEENPHVARTALNQNDHSTGSDTSLSSMTLAPSTQEAGDAKDARDAKEAGEAGEAGEAVRSGGAATASSNTKNSPVLVSVEAIETQLDHMNLVDSRTHDRFLGQNETIDPVAGHIPGASNLSWLDNLSVSGHFLDAEVLKSRFAPVFEKSGPPVFYCGSGVTACHNILATQVAGLPMPSLYAESWSGWISRSNRPVKQGEE